MKITPAIIMLLLIACNNQGKTPATGKDSTTLNGTAAKTESWTENIPLPDTAAVPATRLIIPGKSIGLIAMGEKKEDIDKQFGPPVSEDPGMGGRYSETWESKPFLIGKDTIKYVVEINFIIPDFGLDHPAIKPQEVENIQLTSPYFMTAQHIGVGSSLQDILKNFSGLKKGEPYTSDKNVTVDVYVDDLAGILFEIENGKCTLISIYKPA